MLNYEGFSGTNQLIKKRSAVRKIAISNQQENFTSPEISLLTAETRWLKAIKI
ncbi:MAG: hypothetical protein OXD49_14005 [Candidatus Poribacteria bacterium]|nr:hypothetical protein [Candidatus Poribacteria bacterium]